MGNLVASYSLQRKFCIRISTIAIMGLIVLRYLTGLFCFLSESQKTCIINKSCQIQIENAALWINVNFVLLFSLSVMSDSLRSHGLQHARLSCPSLYPVVCSNSCSLSWWGHPNILSSVAPFSFELKYLHMLKFDVKCGMNYF